MRLHFTLSPNTEPVPFDYQHRLTGVFHKWLARNDLHDKISLYSLSWLDGSRRVSDRLEFQNGARWFTSFFEDEHAEKLVNGALSQPEMFCGMRVLQIEQQKTPDFGSKYKFKVASPVWIKGKQDENKKVKYYFHNEPEAGELLTATLRHKMQIAGLTNDAKSASVNFDHTFRSARVKKVTIKGVGIKGSICPVIVEGSPEAVRFAWNVGIGNGTGSCFGSLKE